MADRVDSMSDAELRTKLAEHGFPVMPITASTRKLLVKKLKLVLDNKCKPRTTVDNKVEKRRTLARYSSGEDSDIDDRNNVMDKRGRRATTGGSMLPPAVNKTRRPPSKRDSPAKRDSDKGSESEEEKPIHTHEEVETVTTRRVTHKYGLSDQDDYETGSDSDIDGDRKTSSPVRSNSRASDRISSTLPTAHASTSPPMSSIFSRPSISPTNYSSIYKPKSTMTSSDQLNSIRTRLGLTSSLGDRPFNNYSSTYTSNTYQPSTSTVDEVESPYLSNFTRRLSTLKSDPKPTPYLDRDSTNGSTLTPRRSYITGVSRSEIGDITSEKKLLKNNLVSLALVVLVALFFFCLFFMYMVKKNDITSVVDDQNSVIPICQLNIPGNRPGINCVPKEQVTYAKDLLKVIHPELTARLASYKCGQPGVLPYMTESEILNIASSRAETTDMSQCRTDFNNLQVLLIKNPQWGLNVVALKNVYSKDAQFSIIASNDLVVQHRATRHLAITLADASTPLSCLFLNTLYSAGSTIFVVSVLTLFLFGIQRFYKYYVSYKKRKSEEVYSMVEQIIDIISQETEGESAEPYISVDHVRDTLISPQNRDKMSSVWDAAVKFIQRNESRVRMEVQSVDGEDCRVWRWVSSSSPKRSAAWQGQAFETQEGSVNNPTVSPTPCLKIRHMFDKNDTNPKLRTVLQDEILEKCGDNCDILHIDIDRNSCCVYVKCASSAGAGAVYRSLHGWWYDGRLITVRYLRLERYMQRFPESPASGPYLRLSRPRRPVEQVD